MLNNENLLMYICVYVAFTFCSIVAFNYLKLKENFLKISLIIIVFLWSALLYDSAPTVLFMNFSWGQEDLLNYNLSISLISVFLMFNFKNRSITIKELTIYYFTVMLMFLLAGTTSLIWLYVFSIIIFLLNRSLFEKKSKSLFNLRFLILTLYLLFGVIASGDGSFVANDNNILYLTVSGGLSIFVLVCVLLPYNVFNKEKSSDIAILHSFFTIPLIYSKWLVHIQDLYLELQTETLENSFYLCAVLVTIFSLLILIKGFQKNKIEAYYAIFTQLMLILLPVVFHTSISNTDLMDINKYSVMLAIVLLLSYMCINRHDKSRLDSILSINLLLFSSFLLLIMSVFGNVNLILPLWSISKNLTMILVSISLVLVIISVRLLKINYKADQFHSNISYNSIGTVIVLLIYYGIIVYK
ncbi:hypothetical protein OAT67_03820 [Bacteriovoracaceae bacterium]|nr:hypothetical protein [Bacteriovoracaceae bacterium]